LKKINTSALSAHGANVRTTVIILSLSIPFLPKAILLGEIGRKKTRLTFPILFL